MTNAADDPLSRMFQWWNQAYKTPGAYVAEAFGRFFTPDGAIVIDGREIARGPAELAAHFQKIQAAGGEAEIVVPFREVFRAGDKIYTYHLIRTRRDGVAMCMLAAGHAVMRDEKIALVSLVRTRLDSTNVTADG